MLLQILCQIASSAFRSYSGRSVLIRTAFPRIGDSRRWQGGVDNGLVHLSRKMRRRRWLWLWLGVVGSQSSDEHRKAFHCTKEGVECSIAELGDESWRRKLKAKAMYVLAYETPVMVPALKLVAVELKKVGIGVGALDVGKNPKTKAALRIKKKVPAFFFCPDADPGDCERHKISTPKEPLSSDDIDHIINWALEEAVDELMIVDHKLHIAHNAYVLLEDRKFGSKSDAKLHEDKDDLSHIARDARGDLHPDLNPFFSHDEL